MKDLKEMLDELTLDFGVSPEDVKKIMNDYHIDAMNGTIEDSKDEAEFTIKLLTDADECMKGSFFTEEEKLCVFRKGYLMLAQDVQNGKKEASMSKVFGELSSMLSNKEEGE